MKIVRIKLESGEIVYGSLLEDGRIERLEKDIFKEATLTGEFITGELLAPVVPPTIYCIGLNYRKHAEESGMAIPKRPVLFMKSPSSIQHPGGDVLLPDHAGSSKVDYECELAVVIGKEAKNVKRENALDYVLGCTCANDVSARDWQIEWGGSQWCRGKTFDTFCPLGPVITTLDDLGDPNNLAISTILNGEKVQNSNTCDMIFSVPEIIEFLSASTTLAPGTVILTGTPEGVGMGCTPPRWLKVGDKMRIIIQGIGELANTVVAETT